MTEIATDREIVSSFKITADVGLDIGRTGTG